MKLKKVVSFVLALSLVLSQAGGQAVSKATKKQQSVISLSKTAYTLAPDATVKLQAKVSRSLKKQKLVWKSNKKSVATVNQKGVVKAVKNGKATITIGIKGSNKTAKCRITVATPVTSVKLTTPNIIYLQVSEKSQIKAQAKPAKASNRKLTYSSNNADVVEVSNKGVVLAKAIGNADITVKAADGSGKKAKIKVVVTEATTENATTMATTQASQQNNTQASEVTTEAQKEPTTQASEATTEAQKEPTTQASETTTEQPKKIVNTVQLEFVGEYMEDINNCYEDDVVHIIRNYEELQEVIAEYEALKANEQFQYYSEDIQTLIAKFNSYDASYFEENTLCFYHKKYQILYEDYELEKVQKETNQKGEGYIQLYVNKIEQPYLGDSQLGTHGDLGGFAYFVQLAKKDAENIKDVSVIMGY